MLSHCKLSSPPHLQFIGMDLFGIVSSILHRFCAAHTGMSHRCNSSSQGVPASDILAHLWLWFLTEFVSVFRIVVSCNLKASRNRLSRSCTILMMWPSFSLSSITFSTLKIVSFACRNELSHKITLVCNITAHQPAWCSHAWQWNHPAPVRAAQKRAFLRPVSPLQLILRHVIHRCRGFAIACHYRTTATDTRPIDVVRGVSHIIITMICFQWLSLHEHSSMQVHSNLKKHWPPPLPRICLRTQC